MDSDIEMLEQKSASTLVTPPSLPALPPSDSQQVSPIAPDIDDGASAGPDVSSPPENISKLTADIKVKAKPASAKPKSTKARARSPSPSPPPLVPPPPLETIRLEINLGGPDNYEVDVAALAKATGQRPATPPPAAKRYESESDGEGAPESGVGTDGGGEKKNKKKKKKNLASEYYDLTDPFIDDSELAIDERTFIAQTKQQGFYVFSGEVALLKEKSHRKPKSKKSMLPAPEPIAGPSNYPHTLSHNTHSQGQVQGTKDVPIALLSDGEEISGKRRTRHSAESPNGKKKRRVVDIHPFHPDLEAAIEDLKMAISKENWEPKGKFPPGIRPVLGAVTLKAIKLNEYNDNLFNLMPRIFPYNRFTMSKLIKRQIFPEHMALLVKRQDELLVELKAAADEGFLRAKEEWERSVTAWEKKQEKTKAESGETASVEGSPASKSAPLPPGDDGITMDVDKSADGEGKDIREVRDAHPPAKKYKMTEGMKGLIWNLVCLSNECCRIENEKNTLEGSASQVSEQGLRKALYQKVVAAFPDGWMSSGQVSREVSVMKKKFEKEAMESES
ncbi:hypothetical protein B0F90DRAFT_1743105 [Multifurca ochricompacta]|uniref:Ubinuclein middle domain-containing protein n=1 Tax=Multifurca ochricompacta TaxID=376703 RepID=A0AAD4QKD4_9AGAM|nr:hypothetical protein B0F90DRAFT_1743105 [Multifurca ochricompacta]